jgi:hypothetical protein
VLAQLGHPKAVAREMVERVLSRGDGTEALTPEAIVELALR